VIKAVSVLYLFHHLWDDPCLTFISKLSFHGNEQKYHLICSYFFHSHFSLTL